MRLSIIVPLYNSAAYLPKCLDSLLKQDIPADEYEIILVNDGSPDNSKEIAEGYASSHTNIRVLSQENRGTSGARNSGLRQACAKYVYFVDPDDYILENSLRSVLDTMDRDDLDIIRFGYTEVDENYLPTASCKRPETPDYSSKIMTGKTFLAERLGTACYVWTYIFKLSIIKDNNIYFKEGDYFDDTPWLPRVCLKAQRVDSINVKRHFYLIRSNSLVQSASEKSIKRKIDGQMFLIQLLTAQRKELYDPESDKWYGMMLAHCTISLLGLVAKHCYGDIKLYISKLRGWKAFPLSLYRSSHNIGKYILISISPLLFCFIIHLKNAQ